MKNSFCCAEGKGEIFEIAPYLIFRHTAANISIINIHALGDGYQREYEKGKIHALFEGGKIPSYEEIRREI